MRRRRVRAGVATVALVAVLGAACSPQTATAPTGRTTLYASFDDAQDLTAGHKVQISNVPAGSVRAVELDGYRARVRLSIVDGRRIPVGTTAVIRRTSLLGEHFVDLVFPDRPDIAKGPFLEDGDEIEATDSQPDIEQLAQRASALVGSLTAHDLALTVQAGAEALGGRGAVLHQAVQDAATVLGALADQQVELGTAIDGLATLGRTLAPVSDRLGDVIDELSTTTAELAGSRAGAVQAVEALVSLARATNDAVIEPHAERLRTMLEQVHPILGSLAERTDVLADLVNDLLRFTEAFPTALHNGTVLLLAWAFIESPDVILGSVPSDPLEALARLVGGAP